MSELTEKERAVALATAVLVYNYKYQSVIDSGRGVNKAKQNAAWAAIVEFAKETKQALS